MTEQKETVTPAGRGSGILELAGQSLVNSLVGKIFIGISLIFLANQTFGDPIGKFMDQTFQLQSQEQTNTYQLQVTTLEFLQNNVMSKLDDIYDRLDTVEIDIVELNDKLGEIEIWIQEHE